MRGGDSGALVLRGDALQLPLPDGCVDLIVTSPPYWALRDYQTPGQLGSESTPQEFLSNLWAATAEMVRVLKPTGSIFVDLGDKYGGGVWPSKHGGSGTTLRNFGPKTGQAFTPPARSLGNQKSLLLLPERYRVGCVDQLNLTCRAVIVWDKPNSLPESVRDRVRRSHEDWVHLVKQPRYYSAVDEVREPHTMRPQRRPNGHKERQKLGEMPAQTYSTSSREDLGVDGHPLGKLPGSVWTVPSEPLRLPAWLGVDHYAAFPSEWSRRFILGWSPPGICLECGMGRWPVVDRRTGPDRPARVQGRNGDAVRHGQDGRDGDRAATEATILGYACVCTPHTSHRGKRGDWTEGREESAEHRSDDWHSPGNAVPRRRGGFGPGGKHPPPDMPMIEYHLDGWTPPPTRPALVLDPFGGTGTVGMVARALGRHAISLDLSHGYSRAARWRIFHSGNAGKALARTNAERQVSLL